MECEPWSAEWIVRDSRLNKASARLVISEWAGFEHRIHCCVTYNVIIAFSGSYLSLSPLPILTPKSPGQSCIFEQPSQPNIKWCILWLLGQFIFELGLITVNPLNEKQNAKKALFKTSESRREVYRFGQQSTIITNLGSVLVNQVQVHSVMHCIQLLSEWV